MSNQSSFPFQTGAMNQHYVPYRDFRNNPFATVNSEPSSQKVQDVFQNSSHLSVKNEPSIEYEKREHYLVITSLNRDAVHHPNVNHYQINLEKPYKNVHAMELIQSILPDRNNITTEPYILLKIDELQDTMDSVDDQIADSFAILCLPPTTGSYLVIDKRIHENTIKTFVQPKASLERLTVTLTDNLGQPFDFGPGTEKQLQNTLVFKVVTLEKKRADLNHRNVF